MGCALLKKKLKQKEKPYNKAYKIYSLASSLPRKKATKYIILTPNFGDKFPSVDF